MQGLTNHQIAHDLLISTSTVKKHVRCIISKLGVSDRTQAAVRAIKLGLCTERNNGQLAATPTHPRLGLLVSRLHLGPDHTGGSLEEWATRTIGVS